VKCHLSFFIFHLVCVDDDEGSQEKFHNFFFTKKSLFSGVCIDEKYTDCTCLGPWALRQNRNNALGREPLLKRKAQYGWPPDQGSLLYREVNNF
jgi:hypothetical protein